MGRIALPIDITSWMQWVEWNSGRNASPSASHYSWWVCTPRSWNVSIGFHNIRDVLGVISSTALRMDHLQDAKLQNPRTSSLVVVVLVPSPPPSLPNDLGPGLGNSPLERGRYEEKHPFGTITDWNAIPDQADLRMCSQKKRGRVSQGRQP